MTIPWDAESRTTATGWCSDVLLCAYREDIALPVNEGRDGYYTIAELLEMTDDADDFREACVLAEKAVRALAVNFTDFFDDTPVMPRDEVMEIGKKMRKSGVPEDRWLDLGVIYLKNGASRNIRLIRFFGENPDLGGYAEFEAPFEIFPISPDALKKYGAESSEKIFSEILAGENPAENMARCIEMLSRMLKGESPADFARDDPFSRRLLAMTDELTGLSGHDIGAICKSARNYMRNLASRIA